MNDRAGSLFLKPAPGRRVRHADGRLFADDRGRAVPATPHYLRLRASGDLVPAGATRTRSTRKKKSAEGSKTR